MTDYRYSYHDKESYATALANIRKGVEQAVEVFEYVDCRIERRENQEIDYYQTTVYFDKIGKKIIYEVSGFEPIPGWGDDYEIWLFCGEYDIEEEGEVEIE